MRTAPQSEGEKRATWEQQAIKRLGELEDVTDATFFWTSDEAAFITGPAIVVDGRSVSDRLNGRRRKEGKLVQGGANRVLKLGVGNVEDFRADFGREAHQNSKNKAVPQQRRQQKKAAKFRRKQFEPVESVRKQSEV